MRGEFPLTERPDTDTCKQCAYIGLCRKQAISNYEDEDNDYE